MLRFIFNFVTMGVLYGATGFAVQFLRGFLTAAIGPGLTSLISVAVGLFLLALIVGDFHHNAEVD